MADIDGRVRGAAVALLALDAGLTHCIRCGNVAEGYPYARLQGIFQDFATTGAVIIVPACAEHAVEAMSALLEHLKRRDGAVIDAR